MQHIQEMNRQHPYAAPVSLVNNQQNMSKSPIMGQQNLSNSQMQPHLLPVQSMDHSQPSPLATGVSSQVSPHLPTGLHGHSANYQTQVTNLQNNSLPQSEVELYNSAPPPPSQTAGSPMGSGLLQSEVRQYAPPVSTMGQSMASSLGSNPVLPQARYKLHSQPISSVPGQTVASPTGPGLVQSGQFNTAPPLSGQNLPGSVGMNRVPPSTISGYQQPTSYQQTGYHNQMVQKLDSCLTSYINKTMLTNFAIFISYRICITTREIYIQIHLLMLRDISRDCNLNKLDDLIRNKCRAQYEFKFY